MKKTIVTKCTKPQLEFYNLKCKYPLFVAGYGSGKTQTLINSAFNDATHSPDALIALYAPTYDLIKLILAPRLEAKLEEEGVPYNYNKLDSTVTTQHPQIGNFILKSLDTPERIVGYQAYRSHIDELDTLPFDQAAKAWVKILGRNRQVPKGIEAKDCFNRVSAYSTPEGFRFLYHRWVAENPNPEKYQYITASSTSNPFLPKDYIESLMESYDEKLRAAYLDGKFVNLVSGTVYYGFDREKNHTNLEYDEHKHKDVHIGIDFNVGKMAAAVGVFEDEVLHIVKEFDKIFDTPALIERIKENFPNANIHVYPDASSSSRNTNNASVTDLQLLTDAGFTVCKNRKNPKVKDRVNSMNSAFHREKVKVNLKLKQVVSCLEQQPYDDKGVPDKSSGKDHMNDALGYMVTYLFPIIRPQVSIVPNYPMR